MAHKTKVGGTAYEITGGAVKVGGTKYSIKKGRTLVGGTGYDILFERDVTITMTSAGSTQLGYNNLYFLIGSDTTKNYQKGTYTVVAGTVITFYVKGAETDTQLIITMDGVTVVSGKGQSAKTYALTIENSISVSWTKSSSKVTVTITTTS